MSVPNQICQLLSNLVSKSGLSLPSRVSITVDGVAGHLFDILESIITSHSYTYDYETTLDYDSRGEEFDWCEQGEDNALTDPDFDIDVEEASANSSMTALESFSLDYIPRALVYYDEINPKTGKKCITFTFFNFRTISVNTFRKFKNIGHFVKDCLKANYACCLPYFGGRQKGILCENSSQMILIFLI